MTLHRVLAELKTLDKRITSAIGNLDVITTKKGDKIDAKVTDEQFEKTAKADYDSVLGLIKRRYELKRALIRANATTMVKIEGFEPMTITEALDYKQVLEYEQATLSKLRTLQATATRKYDNAVAVNESRINELVQSIVGKNSDNNTDTAALIKSVTTNYNNQNGITMVDPINIAQKIKALEEKIDKFNTSIDATLSEVNALTVVEV